MSADLFFKLLFLGWLAAVALLVCKVIWEWWKVTRDERDEP